MNPQTDWLSALTILAAGLILGAIFLFMTRRSKKSSDLEARRDALVEKLRNPDLDPAERQALELETAGVLRAIDDVPASAEVVPASPFLAAAMKGFAWGVSTFATLGALGYMVAMKASPRTAPVPASAPRTVDTTIESLRTKIAAEPQNVELRNDLAQKELERDNLMAVFEETKLVLEQDPENSRALTLQAMVRAAMGEGDRAMEMLQRATKSDPLNLDARVALAWVYAQNGRMAEAEKTIAGAIKDVPSEKPLLEKVLQQIKAPR
jgi:tetratricopeptide (TPR) repeat protein